VLFGGVADGVGLGAAIGGRAATTGAGMATVGGAGATSVIVIAPTASFNTVILPTPSKQ
jgi:hypothetical protein